MLMFLRSSCSTVCKIFPNGIVFVGKALKYTTQTEIKWTPAEDETLLKFVKTNGRKWTSFTNHFAPHRTTYECWQRYDHLNSVKRGPLSRSEIQKLREGVEEYGVGNWASIGRKYLPDRHLSTICNAWYYKGNPQIENRKWTESEDGLLRKGIAKYGTAYSKIAKELLPHRTRQSIRYRISVLSTDTQKTEDWTPEEQQLLLRRVIMFGASNWAKIAEGIPGRSSYDCQRMWNRKLNPTLYQGEWNQKEVRTFWQLVNEFGKAWHKISHNLPGRSNYDCYNLFWTTYKKDLGSEFRNISKCDVSNEQAMDFAAQKIEEFEPNHRLTRLSDNTVVHIKIGTWCPDEISKLIEATKQYKNGKAIDWDKVLNEVPNRTRQQCVSQYYYQIRKKKYEDFTQEEDETLIKLVAKHGEHWDIIATEMPKRTMDTCRLRWKYHLQKHTDASHMNGRQFSEEEKDLIKQGISMFGTDWEAISKTYIPERSPSSCRNWWYRHGQQEERGYTTAELDNFLEIAVKSQEDVEIDWNKVASMVPHRNAQQCKKRWRALAGERRPWTDTDDIALLEATLKFKGNTAYKGKLWQSVAKELGYDRTSDECASRYHNLAKRRASRSSRF
ncbi:Myblike DNAbinding domain-containing protein [Umbelopsis sp. WA50703]